MNKNETRALWISIGSAVFAMLLLYSYVQEKSAELTSQFGSMRKVVVAKKEIQEMQTIDETMIEITEKPVNFVEPKAVQDMELVIGQVALAPINKAEQILETKVMKPGPITGLSLKIAPGKRALTLPVDEVRGVGKLLKPGDHIDILASLSKGSGLNRKVNVSTILQDVNILATGQKIVNDLPRLYEKTGKDEYITNIRGDTSFSTITVEVSPLEAQRLVYILATGPEALFYTLKHPTDRRKINPLSLPAASSESFNAASRRRPAALKNTKNKLGK